MTQYEIMFKPEYISHYFLIGGSAGYFSNGKEIYPSTYLEFAKVDLNKNTDRRSLVNAISNAKRAFHFQVEMLCDAFGWEELYKDKNVGFPKKLEFLGKCGILSPNILRKLNRKRNEIEHDYYIPNLEEVEDYIDIVELFLMATKDLLDRFPEHVDYELMKDEDYDSSLNLPAIITVFIIVSKGELRIEVGKNEITKNIHENDFFIWLSAIMSQYVL